jgi:hypothetical protein
MSLRGARLLGWRRWPRHLSRTHSHHQDFVQGRRADDCRVRLCGLPLSRHPVDRKPLLPSAAVAHGQHFQGYRIYFQLKVKSHATSAISNKMFALPKFKELKEQLNSRKSEPIWSVFASKLSVHLSAETFETYPTRKSFAGCLRLAFPQTAKGIKSFYFSSFQEVSTTPLC